MPRGIRTRSQATKAPTGSLKRFASGKRDFDKASPIIPAATPITKDCFAVGLLRKIDKQYIEINQLGVMPAIDGVTNLIIAPAASNNAVTATQRNRLPDVRLRGCSWVIFEFIAFSS